MRCKHRPLLVNGLWAVFVRTGCSFPAPDVLTKPAKLPRAALFLCISWTRNWLCTCEQNVFVRTGKFCGGKKIIPTLRRLIITFRIIPLPIVKGPSHTHLSYYWGYCPTSMWPLQGWKLSEDSLQILPTILSVEVCNLAPRAFHGSNTSQFITYHGLKLVMWPPLTPLLISTAFCEIAVARIWDGCHSKTFGN